MKKIALIILAASLYFSPNTFSQKIPSKKNNFKSCGISQQLLHEQMARPGNRNTNSCKK
jgi:hypothetical protein